MVHNLIPDQVGSQVQLVGADPPATGKLAQRVLWLQQQSGHAVAPQMPILNQVNSQRWSNREGVCESLGRREQAVQIQVVHPPRLHRRHGRKIQGIRTQGNFLKPAECHLQGQSRLARG